MRAFTFIQAPAHFSDYRFRSAGLAGAFVDRIVETKGLDYIDKQKAVHHAKEHAQDNLANEYN